MGFLTPSANGAAVKINNQGDKFQGTVSGPVELRQMLDFQTKQPAFYKNGNPKVEAVVPFDGVDGLPYRLFVPEFGNLKESLEKAAVAAKTDDFYIGSQWTIENTGKQPTSKGMMAHTYTAICHGVGNGEGGTPAASEVKMATASEPAAAAAPMGAPFGAAPMGAPMGYAQPVAMPAYGAPQQGFQNGGYTQQQPMMQQAPAAAGVSPWQEPPF